MNIKILLIVIGLILALFVVIGAIVPPIESPDAKYDGKLILSIDSSSPYHAYVEWEKDGVTDSAEFTREGKYLLTIEGKNVSASALAWKIDSSNAEDKLSMRIIGKKLYKSIDTYYPNYDLDLKATGAEDRALQEAD